MITNISLLDKAEELKLPLLGVFSKDQLPKVYRDGFGAIVNLQDSTAKDGSQLPGTHWTAWYSSGKDAAYFDSFAFPPPVSVQKYLENRYRVVYSTKQIQNIRSEVCGYYCLYFLWFMSRHKKIPFAKRFQALLNKFSSDPTKNLTLLKRYLHPL